MKGNVLSKLKYSSVQYIFIKSMNVYSLILSFAGTGWFGLDLSHNASGRSLKLMNIYSLILSFDHWHYATDLTRTSRLYEA